MRTAIFLGLIAIAAAINPDVIGGKGVEALIVMFMLWDILEMFKK